MNFGITTQFSLHSKSEKGKYVSTKGVFTCHVYRSWKEPRSINLLILFFGELGVGVVCAWRCLKNLKGSMAWKMRGKTHTLWSWMNDWRDSHIFISKLTTEDGEYLQKRTIFNFFFFKLTLENKIYELEHFIACLNLCNFFRLEGFCSSPARSLWQPVVISVLVQIQVDIFFWKLHLMCRSYYIQGLDNYISTISDIIFEWGEYWCNNNTERTTIESVALRGVCSVTVANLKSFRFTRPYVFRKHCLFCGSFWRLM